MSGATPTGPGTENAAEKANSQPGESSMPPVYQNRLRAVCHRVKNDFQTIANILDMARSFVSTPSQLATAMEGRIGALAAAYALYADTGNPPTLEKLARQIVIRAEGASIMPVPVTYQMPEIVLSPRLCSSLSLWLYETVSNAMRYGIGDRVGGSVSLSASLENNRCVIGVTDDGPGLPQGFSTEAHAKFGLYMAEAIARYDLAGAMRLVSLRPGFSAVLEFDKEEFDRLSRESWK